MWRWPNGSRQKWRWLPRQNARCYFPNGKPAAVVPRLWPDSTIVILAGGPSLTREDVEYVRGKAPVIAINNSWELAPWADVLYAADSKWWRWKKGVPDFKGLKYTVQPEAGHWPGVQVLKNTGDAGLELNPSGLRTGSNSGYQAVNLAVHLGGKRLVLLGYDMGPDANGRSHWFGEHPDLQRSPYPVFLAKFPAIIEPLKTLGVHVINCSPQTALTIFPRAALRDVL